MVNVFLFEIYEGNREVAECHWINRGCMSPPALYFCNGGGQDSGEEALEFVRYKF